MNVRKLHRVVGLVFSPFFLIAAVTGIALLWRKSGIYEKETTGFLVGLHTWEIVAQYIGVIFSAALICMTVTGLIMLVRSAKKT